MDISTSTTTETTVEVSRDDEDLNLHYTFSAKSDDGVAGFKVELYDPSTQETMDITRFVRAFSFDPDIDNIINTVKVEIYASKVDIDFQDYINPNDPLVVQEAFIADEGDE